MTHQVGHASSDVVKCRLRQIVLDEGREICKVRSNQQRYLCFSRLRTERLQAVVRFVGDDDQVCGWDSKHIEEYPVDVVITEPVSVCHHDGVGAADGSGE